MATISEVGWLGFVRDAEGRFAVQGTEGALYAGPMGFGAVAEHVPLDEVPASALRAHGDRFRQVLRDAFTDALLIHTDEGTTRTTVGEFAAENFEGLDTDTFVQVLLLQPGQSHAGGGGAVPAWTVERPA